MPRQDDFVLDLDEKAGKSANWEMVLNMQIIRTNIAMSRKDPEFPSCVEAFKSDLVFFTDKDEKYHAEMREIELWASQELERRKQPNGSVLDQDIEDVAWARAKLTFEACLRGMGRAGFYPQRKVDFRE